MKRYLIALCCILYLSNALAADNGKEKLPPIRVEVEVSKNFPADECYVLFLLNSTGDSMSAAQANILKKAEAFLEKVKQDFPEAKCDIRPVNFGTRDFSSYRATENPFAPDITKILLLILPPDEDMAIRLLDCGLKSGLLPFCATSPDGTYGAVFLGLKNSQTAVDSLYPSGKETLVTLARKLADASGREIVKMNDFSRFIPQDSYYELRCRDIRVNLPSEFCSIDKDRIKVSLILRAEFLVREEKSGK